MTTATQATLPTIEELMIGSEKFASKLGFTQQGAMRDDLVQEFMVGALEGLQRVDIEREGARTFVWTYATGYAKKYLTRENRAKKEKVKQSITVLEFDGDETNEVKETIRESKWLVSLHTINPWIEGNTFDTIADKKAIDPTAGETEVVNIDLDAALATLTETQQAIIRDRFYGEMTLQEIASKRGVTKEAIRQQEAKALEKLQRELN